MIQCSTSNEWFHVNLCVHVPYKHWNVLKNNGFVVSASSCSPTVFSILPSRL